MHEYAVKEFVSRTRHPGLAEHSPLRLYLSAAWRLDHAARRRRLLGSAEADHGCSQRAGERSYRHVGTIQSHNADGGGPDRISRAVAKGIGAKATLLFVETGRQFFAVKRERSAI